MLEFTGTVETYVVGCFLLWPLTEQQSAFHRPPPQFKGSSRHLQVTFSGVAEGGTRVSGIVLPRVLRAAMSSCSVVMACCWSSVCTLRETADVDAPGVKRGDRRGCGILS